MEPSQLVLNTSFNSENVLIKIGLPTHYCEEAVNTHEATVWGVKHFECLDERLRVRDRLFLMFADQEEELIEFNAVVSFVFTNFFDKAHKFRICIKFSGEVETTNTLTWNPDS